MRPGDGVTDRDLRKAQAGLYSLTANDRRVLYRWLANKIRGNSRGA